MTVARIAGAGVWPGIDIDAYHGDCAPGVSISSSGLRDILLECPAKYWARSHMNPHRIVKETAAMDFGRAAHALVLGEPAFNAWFIVSPYDDFRKKEAQVWRDAQTKTVLKAEQLATIQAMAAAIKRTPQTANAFGDGAPEVSILWQDTEFGIWLKSRPDFLPADPTTHFTQEFKTALTIEPRRLSAQAFSLGYDMQAAMVFDGLKAVTGETPLGVAHIVQEKEPPYLCDLRLFAPEQIEAGRTRYRTALRTFVECLKRQQAGDPPHIAWPGYTDEPTYFGTPKWIIDQVVEMDENEHTNRGSDAFGEILAAG